MVKKIILAIISLCLFTLTGCFDYEEMNELVLLTAIGIDETDGGYKVSAQIIVSKGSALGSAPSMTVKSAEGKTMTEAIAKIQYYYAEPIYLEHIKIVVIGKEIAKKGLGDVIKLIGIIGPFYNFEVTVASNDTAEEVLKAGSFSSHINAMEAASMISLNNVYALPPSVKGFELLTGSGDYVIPELKLKKNEDTDNGTDEEKAKKIIMTEGGAVIRDNKMVGSISGRESGNLLLIAEKTVNCNLSVTEGETVTVLKNERKISVFTEDKGAKAAVSVKLTVDGKITDLKSVTEEIRREMEKTVTKLYKEEQCDVLDLYGLFKSRYPDLYKGKDDFRKSTESLEIEISLKIVHESGKNPLEDGGALK